MPEKTKVRRFGEDLGFIIPASVAEAMRMQEGDAFELSVTPEGILLIPCDPDVAGMMEDARAFMHSHRNAFRELAR
ncbi:hypothetical protein GQ464_007610 [Rhodocaloribacter litoris]|uniref:AbrB/MazE/SpoVT family DNA-binding domain-containing protein n=1 Tax=Rhodocaloribacter litoris TaxID=2558931 RepID=UPI001421613C|nr:AbrB/MazE/SpoVT family DNA-binding domain-containing protein [Rhodocaloribacter litoris]QXD16794.1 hypothetical protein GQ464_007610 [Rhodocaloribacter litoris]